MTTTPVGMRCPECAKQRTRVVRMRAMAVRPHLTYALIAANALVFLAERGQFSLLGSGVYGTVVDEGWLDRYDVGSRHQYWRLLSSAFLHVDILHIFFNMYLLYVLGLMLEPALGSLRFGAIYLVALLAGSFGALLATAAPSLGASGAVFGLMGAAAVELRARRMSVMESGIGLLIIINLGYSFAVSGISIGAHIGGLAGGALAGYALHAAGRRGRTSLGMAACLALCAAAVAGALLVAGSTSAGVA